MASTSSVCPFPSTPAMPRISPGATLKLTWSTAAERRGPPTTRSRTSRSAVSAPGVRAGAPRYSASSASATSRPTIARAIACGVAPAVGICATVRPWRMTVIASLTSITSSSLWVMSTTVPPFARRARSTCHSSCTSGGDSTAVGSSRMRIFAPR